MVPKMRDGDRKSLVRGYIKFLEICTQLRPNPVAAPCPETGGEWCLIDIGQALFQFVQDDGTMVRGGTATCGFTHVPRRAF